MTQNSYHRAAQQPNDPSGSQQREAHHQDNSTLRVVGGGGHEIIRKEGKESRAMTVLWNTHTGNHRRPCNHNNDNKAKTHTKLAAVEKKVCVALIVEHI